jgi:hypothetical protein
MVKILFYCIYYLVVYMLLSYFKKLNYVVSYTQLDIYKTKFDHEIISLHVS